LSAASPRYSMYKLGPCARFNLIGAALLGLFVGASASAAGTDIEQRIRHIQEGLLPPVLVKDEPIPLSSLASRMDELHIPGVSIAVIHAGKIEWARGFGVMRIGGAPVTAESLFQAASISKPVTTLAVMRLMQTGKMGLDIDVNRYLKSWKLPVNGFTDKAPVTLRGLLTHSAGVTVHGFRGYEAGATLPTFVQILNGEPPANNPPIRVDMAPGKTWRYSGGGFVIAQQVLTDETGIAFPRLMHDLVLRPLGMMRSTYQQPLPPELLVHAATPYRSDGTPVPGGPQVYPELGAAGLWTTPSDLARFAIGIQQALSGKSTRVISAKTADDMLTPEYNQQALGLIVGGSTARKWFNHGGVNFGYRCLLWAYQDGDGAVVMVNSDNGDELIHAIVRTIAYQYAWPDYAPPVRALVHMDPELFDRYVGAYRFPSGAIVTFWRDGTHIKSRIWGQPVFEMFPTSEREYFYKAVDARWVFSDGSDGTQSNVTLYQNGQALLKRLDDVEGRIAVDFSVATEKRFTEQTPAAGSESALRNLIAGIATGNPNYGSMRPAYAQIVRQELSESQTSLSQLGPVQSLSFKAVSPAGADSYDVRFEAGTREFKILLEPDGRIHAAEFAITGDQPPKP
jgi:CubicO group peptidase (beta-lactamase class C family)